MCWILQLLGGASLLAGVVVLVLFSFGRGTGPEATRDERRPSTLMLGTALTVVGMLLVVLGFVEGVCRATGVGGI